MARKSYPHARPAVCSRCGEPIAAVGMLLDKRGDAVWAGRCPECDAGHCPKCGAHVSNGYANFCTECGTGLVLKVS